MYNFNIMYLILENNINITFLVENDHIIVRFYVIDALDFNYNDPALFKLITIVD